MRIILSSLLIVFGITMSGCTNTGSPGYPKPDHVVIVIEENHSLDQIIKSDQAPYINSLVNDGLLFTNFHAVTHPSQPNYLALFSGSIQGVKDDHCLEPETPFTTPNLGHELLEKNYTFAGYSEDMPGIGYTGCGSGSSVYPNSGPPYARKHNPWVDWQGTKTNGLPPTTNLPFTSFPTDFAHLPTVSIVCPNQDNDMHNGPDSLSISRGDNWLKTHLDSYIQWTKTHHSLFVLTFDEDNGTPSNHITTLFVGQMVKEGTTDQNYNLYNLLRSVEKMYGLNNAGPDTAKAITGVWK